MYVLWLNSSRQLSTRQLLAQSPLRWDGDRIRRAEVRKRMGRDKDSLIGKAKAVCASKAEQGICSLLPISRQLFSHPRRAGLHHT